MTQKEYVIEAMRRNGGYATFQQLNQMVDFSTWKTKTATGQHQTDRSSI